MRAVASLLDQVGSRSDALVIVDAPPILEHPESKLLLGCTDQVVLVLRAGHTTRRQAKAALRLIEQSGVPVLGTVLNRFKGGLPFDLDGSM